MALAPPAATGRPTAGVQVMGHHPCALGPKVRCRSAHVEALGDALGLGQRFAPCAGGRVASSPKFDPTAGATDCR